MKMKWIGERPEFISQQGRELQTVTEAVWEQLEQETLADLTIEEQYILRRLLHKIEKNLGKIE